MRKKYKFAEWYIPKNTSCRAGYKLDTEIDSKKNWLEAKKEWYDLFENMNNGDVVYVYKRYAEIDKIEKTNSGYFTNCSRSSETRGLDEGEKTYKNIDDVINDIKNKCCIGLKERIVREF